MKPALLVAGERDVPHVRLHAGGGLPDQMLRLAGGDTVAATLQLAHHGKGAVLVGLERLKRVGNEK